MNKHSESSSVEVELVDEILQHRTSANDEARILHLLQGMDADQLNDLLTDERADRLFRAVDNHFAGPDNLDALVELLAVRRAHELDLHARANLIYALQTGRTSHHREEVIADLVCAVTGSELTHLKNIINLRDDQHDLEGLVFIDIDHEDIRTRILDHIQHQAEKLPEAKILSDIDDTIFCKLHDKRYPSGTVYPGALAFLEALDRGPDDDPASMGDITFVTARPMDFWGLLENHSRASLKQAGVADLSVMSGSLFALVSKDAMAGKKVENVSHYIQLYPEYRMTFMGDSGQGDVLVGEKLWELYPDLMDAVFIHDVVGTGQQERDAHAQHLIWFHDTYVGAAGKAKELGLISAHGLAEVVKEAREALETIEWEDDEQRRRVVELFDRDEQALATS